MSGKKKIEKWITVNGRHIPVYEGDSVDDAIAESLAQRKTEKAKERGSSIVYTKKHELLRAEESAKKKTKAAKEKGSSIIYTRRYELLHGEDDKKEKEMRRNKEEAKRLNLLEEEKRKKRKGR